MTVEQLITNNLDLWTSAVTHKKTSGRGSSAKRELTGIKKLRELILELAVRGKLVPQDAGDEPAIELLDRVKAAKAAGARQKSGRKPKALPTIDDAKRPYAIPDSWTFARLGDVVEVVRGITFPASEKFKEPEVGKLACLRTSNVQDQIEWDDLLYIRERFVARPEQFVQHNDIVMSMANSRELVGKVALVDSLPVDRATFGGFLGVLRPAGVHPSYVMALLRSPQTRQELIGSASQTTNIANISMGKLNPLIVALPPLAEQHRIVHKVDELMALCDRLEQQTGDQIEAHERLVDTLLDTLTHAANATELAENWSRVQQNFDTLFTTEHSIDRLKQTILQLAVMGRLVSQSLTDEPATAILEKISDQRERLIAQKAIRKARPVDPIGDYELSFDLPAGWECIRFGQIAFQITDGAHHTPTYTNEGVPFLSVKDMSSGKLDFSDTRFISPETHSELIKRCNPQKGDLLLTKVGTTGIPILVETDESFSIFVSVALIKFDSTNVDGEFLKLLIGSPFVKAQSEAGTEGVGNKNLVLRKIANFVLVLPPLAEQRRIVQRVAGLLSICDQLSENIAKGSELVNRLSTAVVDQAVH